MLSLRRISPLILLPPRCTVDKPSAPSQTGSRPPYSAQNTAAAAAPRSARRYAARRRLLPERDSASASVVATSARLSCCARRSGPRAAPRRRRSAAGAGSAPGSVSVADVSEPASDSSDAAESQRSAGGLGVALAPNASGSGWNCAREPRGRQR